MIYIYIYLSYTSTVTLDYRNSQNKNLRISVKCTQLYKVPSTITVNNLNTAGIGSSTLFIAKNYLFVNKHFIHKLAPKCDLVAIIQAGGGGGI